MRKKFGIILNSLLFIVLYGCASEDVRDEVEKMEISSCTFDQRDGECVTLNYSFHQCNIGTCSEGNCLNGFGILRYPKGSYLEGTFKDGKLNGAGSYTGCGDKFSYSGTFKDNLKDKGTLYTKVKKYSNDKETTEYYKGVFVNEKRNGKGIYFTSGNDKYSKETKIYEGVWKEGIKNGKFIVYNGYNGDYPISEDGVISKSVYEKSSKVIFINDRDKEEIDQEERDRKYQALQEAKEREDRKKEEARQAKYRKEQEDRENKYYAEKEKKQKACEITRSQYSPQCVDYNRIYGRDN